MGSLISFENHALARLRARVAAAEEANQDLIAFARGHSGAVQSVHQAILEAIEADGFNHLIHIVTQEWPRILSLDSVALGLSHEGAGIRADASGLHRVEPRLIDHMIAGQQGSVIRSVGRGHPLFGPACELIRAEALIRLESAPCGPSGMLVLGQREAEGFETLHGSELLIFLGRVLTRCIARSPILDG